MDTDSHRPPDPHSLSALAFIRRAARLPVKDLIGRVGRLCLSLLGNLITIRRSMRRAARQAKSVRYVLLTGRLGDLIAAEPVVRHIKQPDDHLVWLCRPRYADALRFNPYVDEIRSVSSDLEAVVLMRLFGRRRCINLLLDQTLCNVFGTRLKNPNPQGITGHNKYEFGTLTDVFCILGTGRKLNDRPRIYFDRDFDVDAYIAGIFPNDGPILVFHPLSDEFAKSWAHDKIHEFSAWVLDNTPFNLIEVGLSPVLTSGTRVFNMADRLRFYRQMAVVSRADLFVGVDSGFSHVANAAAVPSVLLLGTYRGFRAHLPWPIHDHDIVLRGHGQTHQIEVAAVSDGVSRLMSRMNSGQGIRSRHARIGVV